MFDDEAFSFKKKDNLHNYINHLKQQENKEFKWGNPVRLVIILHCVL